MHVHNMVKKKVASHTVDVNNVPTDDDLYEAGLRTGPNTLMQMLDVDIHGPYPMKGVTFFANGSNIHLIRKGFAEKLD